MTLTPVRIDPGKYPEAVQPYLCGAKTYDSSCSPNARVIFIDRDRGYFLKAAPASFLRGECEMTRYFHDRGLSAEVIRYIEDDAGRGYLLTGKIPGDDCTSQKYLRQPERLCDTLAGCLSHLHSLDTEGCPVPNHTDRYLQRALRNCEAGIADLKYGDFAAPGEARELIARSHQLLGNDTLLHGDYCLPNIILDNWRLSGFIDLGQGGVGDRHVDLFWGAWTLACNLGTDRYRQRFFDAYGRDRIDGERMRLVAACEVFG